MAVDAIETLWAFPHIKTFVIVSGDRDFIHVFKALRRRGKQIIGMAPTETVSDDVATLCDRFIFYTALRHSYAGDNLPGPSPEPSTTGVTSPAHSARLSEVRSVLARLLREAADAGLKGSQVIPLLRRELSPTFDVSRYGFTKLIQLLRACDDLLRIDTSSGGDITLYPVKPVLLPPATPGGAADVGRLIQGYGLNNYRFQPDRLRRHRLLSALYHSMIEQETFVWRSVFDQVVEETTDSSVSITLLSSYQAILWQARTFVVLPGQEGIPVKERRMKLTVPDGEAFIDGYEQSILYKLLERNPNLAADEAALLLGYAAGDTTESARCHRLLAAARQMYRDRSGHLTTVDPQRYAQSSAQNARFLLQALERAFNGMEPALSRGRLTQRLKQDIAGERIDIKTVELEAFLDHCIALGLLLKNQDGVTSVYVLAELRQSVPNAAAACGDG